MVFQFRTFGFSGLRHGITGRDLRLPDEGDISYATATRPESVRANRAFWSAQIGVDPRRITTGRQSHGDHVQVVRRGDAGRGACSAGDGFPATDALVSREAGVALMVVAADCVPILLYDPVKQAIGAVHSGWRGTVAGVVMRTVETMRDEFGSDAGDILVGLGPSIGPCCYEVGSEVIQAWDALGVDPEHRAVIERSPRPYLDLWTANELALAAAGVPREHVERAAICTRCNADRFFSRRYGLGHRGLFGAIIALEEYGS